MMRAMMLLVCGALLSGCAAAALSVAGAGAGVGMATGVDHTLTGTVYKTFAASVNEVRFATLKSLDRMDLKLVRDQAQGGGSWLIEASASERSIEIELERLSSTTTRMRVVASQGNWFLRDSATATEIVAQTAGAMDEHRSRRAGKTPTATAAAERSAR